MARDYTTVTDVPGIKASREQLAMLYTRYRYAAQFCEGKDVLEVACGAGQGLGYLAKKARQVVGGDYTDHLLQVARRHYGEAMPLLRLDAHTLPFRDSSFDVVILYEAIYYLSYPERFVEECRRVLRDRGVLLICTVNREWPDFNPSPFSTQYFSAKELSELLQKHQFRVELLGGFRVAKESTRDAVVSSIKQIAVALRLMPKTMKGKEFLKRIFFGKLVPLPSEVADGMAEYSSLQPVSHDSTVSGYKVLYVVGRI
jgi:ubiquinone/menaquinone biosynthesis C-methylase UbiE